jgi:UDP-glucose 4-epimerase
MTNLLAGRRIAVIGATGFIGSHLVERLVAGGAEVLAISRTPTHLPRLASVRQACGFAVCDIMASAQIRRLLRVFRPDTVYHLAAHPDAAESFAQMTACIGVNTLAVVHALQAATEAGARLFVYGDSSKVYGNTGVPYAEHTQARPICSYAIAKAAAWDLCLLGAATSGTIEVVGLRPTFVYGPRQSRNLITYIHECHAANRPVRLQGGTQTRDPLHIDDAVSAFVAAGCRPAARGHSIPIGGGLEISVADLSRRVLAELGSSEVPLVDGAAPRPTEIWRSCSGNREAVALLGWQPRVSLAEGLRRTLSAAPPAQAAAPREVRLSIDLPAPPCFLHDAGSSGTFAVIDRRATPRHEHVREFMPSLPQDVVISEGSLPAGLTAAVGSTSTQEPARLGARRTARRAGIAS